MIDSLNHHVIGVLIVSSLLLSIFLIIFVIVLATKLVSYHVLMITCLNQFKHSHANELLAFSRSACDFLKEDLVNGGHWAEGKNDGETVSWG